MEILHTGDWHIGDFPGPEENGINCRAQDTLNCIYAICEYAEANQPDLVLVAGDIFHTAQVWASRGLAETEKACKAIERMSRVCPVVVLRGTPNHDGDKQFDMMRSYFSNSRSVKIITEPSAIELYLASGESLQVVGLPGFDRGYFRAKYPGLSAEDENRVFTEELSNIVLGLKAQCDPDIPSVLMSHYTVPGANTESGQVQLFSGAEPVIMPETLTAAGFDLVALGHIHRPQKVEGCRDTYYCGAVNALNFNDEGQERGFWIHELDSSLPFDRLVHSEFHLTPFRKFLTIRLDDNDISMWNSSDTERQHVSTKWHGHAEGAIVRAIYNCTEEHNKAFIPSTMEQAIYDEGAFWIAGILPDKIFPSVSRQELHETTDPESNLIRYLEDKDLPSERIAAVLEIARPIIAQAAARGNELRPTGAFIPISIEVKNYRKYADAVFNFSDISFCTVNGKNGAGKSSLFMDAILDCLFEEPREGDLTGWIRSDEEARSGSIVFTFRIGANTYRVARTRLKSGKATLNLAELADGDWMNLSCEKNKDTQREINNLIGMDSLTLRSCALVMQDQYGLFMEAGKGDRMTILSTILGLGIYGVMEELARIKSTETSREISERKIIINSRQEQIHPEADVRDRLREAQEDTVNINASLEAATLRRDGLIARLAEMEQDISRMQVIEKEIEAVGNERAQLEREQADQMKTIDLTTAFLLTEEEILKGVRQRQEWVEEEKALLSGAALYDSKSAELETAKHEFTVVQQSVAEIATTRAELSDRLENLDAQLSLESELQAASEQYTIENDKLTRMAARTGTYIELSETIEQARKKHAKLTLEYSSEYNRRVIYIKSLEKKTALLNNSGCPVSENATCQFLADARAAQDELKDYRISCKNWKETKFSKIEEAAKQVSDLERQRDALGYDPEAVSKQQQLVASMKSKADKYAALASIREQRGRLQERLQATEQSLGNAQERAFALENKANKLSLEVNEYKETALRRDTIQHKIARAAHWLEDEKQLPVMRERQTTAKKNIDRLSVQLDMKQIRATDLLKEQAELKAALENESQFRTDLTSAEAEVSQYQKHLDNLKLEIGGLLHQLEQIESLKQQNAVMRKEINELSGRASVYDLLRQAFCPDGIPHNIVVSNLPRLTSIANSILGQMTGGKMGMEFVTEKTLKSNKDKEIATLDVKITESGHQSIGYASKSGGEKVKAALSAILALSEIQSITTGIRPGFLFIDEPPFLDDEGTQAYCDALETIKAKYPELKIMTITHDPTMKARFPQSVDVVKDESGSRIIAA